MTITLRMATLDDIPLLVGYLQKTLEASPAYSRITFSVDRAVVACRARLEATLDTGCTLIAYNGESPVGALCGAKTELPFSTDQVATEFLFYVEPGHPRAAYKLLEAYAYWARKAGCKVLSVGVFGDKQHFERKGFVKAESLYMKELR